MTSSARVTLQPVVIPNWAPPLALSPNRAKGRHWGTLQPHIRSVHLVVETLVRVADWPPQAESGPRRRLTITVWRKRRLDADNETATLKYVQDAVKATGALFNDSPRYMELVVVQRIGPSKTVLELEEIG